MKIMKRTKPRREKGAILFIVAASLIVLLGFLGLAIDLGHAYNNKTQLQNMADACALAGATALDGTAAGIHAAADRASDALGRLSNKTEFNTTSVTFSRSQVTFSPTLNAANYLDVATAQGVASTIRYVKVAIPPQSTAVYFAKVIPGIPASLNFGAEAVAGQNPLTNVCNGLGPFSPVRQDTTLLDPTYCSTHTCPDPSGNFGFQLGQFYTLRQPGGSSGSGSDVCAANGILGSMTGSFGLADPQGCGTNTPCYRDTIVNGSSNSCVSLNGTVPTVTGNKGQNVEDGLDTRYAQDGDHIHHDWNSYMTCASDPTGACNSNPWRRVVPVPVNDGVFPSGQGNYNVVGLGCFFMPYPPHAQPPSSAICLQYVGSCDVTGRPTANPGGGMSITKIVLFK